MSELRSDMLPDKSETHPEVSEEPIPSPAPEPEVPETEPQTPAPSQPSKPEKAVPLASFLEERRLRKEAEKKLKDLSSVPTPEEEPTVTVEPEAEPVEDESLRERVARIERENLYLKHPEIADKQADFETFLTEYPEYPLESAVKIFKAEKGLYEATPARSGLERPTGGPKTPPQTGWTPAQLKELREEHPRKYAEYLRSGKIKTSEISW